MQEVGGASLSILYHSTIFVLMLLIFSLFGGAIGSVERCTVGADIHVDVVANLAFFDSSRS